MSKNILDLEHGEEIIADDENANTAYFLEEQGHYYFHTDSQPVITSVGEVITPDNEVCAIIRIIRVV